jgi:polar amino acid transport system substrate-binding protein
VSPAPRRAAGVVLGLIAVVLLSACGTGTYTPTTVPTPTATTAAPGSTATPTPVSCDNPTQSYDPAGLTGAAADNAVKAIKDRGYLIAGVSADSWLLGSRNPLTNQIEGFDIDMVNALAKAIFGDSDPKHVNLVVITAADRIKALQDNRVDVVVRNMTMTCDRWTQIAFSAEYYRSGLKILVDKDSPVTTLEGLAGKKVCAPNGTSTMEKVKATQGLIAVGADTHTGCLVMFQEGEIDAIAGDDTVLAGLVAQDPYAKVPEMPRLTDEPYGIGVNKDKIDLVRYINRVLETVKAPGGAWQASYDKWFLPRLKVEATPPQSQYGRT